MRSIIRTLVWSGLLTVFFVSCQSTSQRLPTPLATPKYSLTQESSITWWTTWLTEPVCKPPCWQNIIPGVTNIEEAVSILESTPGVTVKLKSKDGVDWEFNQNRNQGGTIKMSADNIVNTIWLYSPLEGKALLDLESIVMSYNNPEYVKPYDCREGKCSAMLVYPDLGMLLDVYVDNTGTVESPNINMMPTTTVRRVYFIEQGLDNFEAIPDFQEYYLLMRWHGYGEYPER
jgi:hypothetical protein